MQSLRNSALIAVTLSAILSLLLFLHHENMIRIHNKQNKTKIIKNIQNNKIETESYNKTKIENGLLTNNNKSIATLARKGLLICNGKSIDSEIIYWKIVKGDDKYISPFITSDSYKNNYLSFEYDHGGWNNIRISMESIIVFAHAIGRTLVVPPPQHLYLLSQKHKDPNEKFFHYATGFEDFFDIELLKSHGSSHIITMQEFLEKEAITGNLKNQYPPNNKSDAWGSKLWPYLFDVADIKPALGGRFIALPDKSKDFFFNTTKTSQKTIALMNKFGGGRKVLYYDDEMRNAKHIHIPGHDKYRLLEHFYSFIFFADRFQQSFYKRYIRDYMRYRDEIQCAAHELLLAVRKDALITSNNTSNIYYALHIRRGDFQYKDVKLTADQILKNLHFPNGSAVIPSNSLVYISTDDPDGICLDCLVQRQPCTSYKSPKPVGCPEPTSWDAFIKFGWKIRFLKNYLQAGVLKDINTNWHGMIESIVCSRAKIFAGTFFSTYTGYIMRLRGYHGMGEDSYYHSNDKLLIMQQPNNISRLFGSTREWRIGWTDDNGNLI